MKKLAFLLALMIFSCGEDQPFLAGYIKQAYDAVLAPCDPYGKGVTHTCVVFSSVNQGHLYAFDGSAQEMVLSPISYRPLVIEVSKTADNMTVPAGIDKSFPWVFVLDGNEQRLYAVRMFPSADGQEPSFMNPKAQTLSTQPKKMAAALYNDKVIAIFTLPQTKQVQFLAINKATGDIDESIPAQTLVVGDKPSQVAIIGDQVVISDEGSADLHVLKLSEISAYLAGGAAPSDTPINIGMESDKLSLATLDLGAGAKPYALVLEALGQQLSLVNLDDKSNKNITLDDYPMATYFPQDGEKFKEAAHWFSVVTIKGSLEHYSISDTMELAKINTIDLLAKDNLDLSTLQVVKILGGTIEPDTKKKRNKTCPNNRQVIYVASGNSRYLGGQSSLEVEAHSYACETEQTATRLGHKNP